MREVRFPPTDCDTGLNAHCPEHSRLAAREKGEMKASTLVRIRGVSHADSLSRNREVPIFIERRIPMIRTHAAVRAPLIAG